MFYLIGEVSQELGRLIVVLAEGYGYAIDVDGDGSRTHVVGALPRGMGHATRACILA